MQIDLASHIEKLIFLHDTVVVPQFGGFVATRIRASADENGSGAINPPTRALAFNETLVYDDGLLIADIAQAHGISADEAREAVQKEVENLQSRLNQREIVSLNGIGRLYKNYVQKIQFLPDSANFSTESYGLPPLQFSTIARSREVTDVAAPAVETPSYTAQPASTPNVDTVAPEYAPRRGRWVTPTLIALLLVIASLAVWRWQSNNNGLSWMERLRGGTTVPDSTEQVVDVQPETAAQTNQKPEEPQTPSQDIIDSTDKKLEVEMLTKPEPKKEEQTIVLTPEAQEVVLDDKEKAKPAAGKGKECIIVIATLRDENNAQKLQNKLSANNYTVYSDKTAKGHQVGIRFYYTNVSEIQQNIVALQQLTGEQQIWIKKK